MFIIFNESFWQTLMNRNAGKLKSMNISSTNIVFPEIMKEIIKNSIIIILENLKILWMPIRINSNRDRYLPRNSARSSRVKRKCTSFLHVKSRLISTSMMQWRFGKWTANQNDNFYLYRHLRDLASGTKKIIKSNSIKFIAIPHYEGLAVKHLLLFARNYPDELKYLPVEKEI